MSSDDPSCARGSARSSLSFTAPRPLPVLKLLAAVLLVFFLSVSVSAAERASVLLLSGSPTVGEEIRFSVEGSPSGFRIQSSNGVYRYLGIPENPVIFIPSECGEHRVFLTDGRGDLLDELSFIVACEDDPFLPVLPVRDGSAVDVLAGEPDSGPGIVSITPETGVGVTFRDPGGRTTGARLRLLDSGQLLEGRLASSVGIPANDRADIELISDDAPFERLLLRGARVRGLSIGVDRPPRSGIRLGAAATSGLASPQTTSIVSAFAIDPAGADFSTGELVKVAEGSALYKCREWDFAARRCVGEWVHLRDLVPGEEYSIPLSAQDPGFVETGVATVNSLKPLYVPLETAELIMVVLDTRGFLVTGADVRLTVTRPDGTSDLLSTGSDSITEEGVGIYRARYGDRGETGQAGTYGLFVEAFAPGVNMSLASSFDVAMNYLYDILRDVPATIDPWDGPFTGSITIDRHDAPPGPIDVTERLPGSFSVVDAGGASVQRENGSSFLLWRDVDPGTRLTYRANAPLVSPDLYALGEITVASAAGLQVEARPWYLAIDPTETLTPIVHVNTEVGGVDLTSTQVSDISADDTAYVTFTKNTVLTVELSDPGNTSPINGVSSLSCSVTYTGQAYSPAATFRVDDAFAGNQLGSTTLPASTGGDNTVTLTNLQNDADFSYADLFTLNVYIRNNDGGTPQTISVDRVWCTVTYTVADITAPTVSLNRPAEKAYLSSSTVVFNYTAYDNRGFDRCSLYIDGVFNRTNSTPIVNNTDNAITATIDEGAHNWTVACTDTSANTGWASEVRNLTVDLTDPTTFGLSAPPNATVSTDLTPLFSWDATVETNFRNYTLIVDDDPLFSSPNYERATKNTVTNTSFQFTTVISSNTPWYWKVIAYDLAGRHRESDETWVYITDTTFPTAFALVSPASGTISANRTPDLDWASVVETNFANYTIQFDDDPAFTSIDHLYLRAATVADSDYGIGAGEPLGSDTAWYWRVIAYDRAGQSRTSIDTFTYTTDNTAPDIALDHPPEPHEETVTNTIEFNYSVIDALSAVSSCRLIIDGAVEQTDPTITEGVTQTFTQYLENGLYGWWINCTDGAGNVNESEHRSLLVNVTVDTTPPLVTLVAPAPDAFRNSSAVIFAYSVQDATGIENCSLLIDGSVNRTNTSVVNGAENLFTVDDVSEGIHEWMVSCFDNATSLNQGDSTSRNLTIDLTPPTAFSLLAPPDGTKTNIPVLSLDWGTPTELYFANYTVQIDNDSDLSSPEYVIVVPTLGESNATTPPLLDGDYFWRVIAYDSAGNSRASSQTWTFELHTQAPIILDAAEYPNDPVAYNPYRTYNFTLTLDEDELDAVRFEHDFLGGKLNHTPTGNNSDVHYYEIGPLAAATYAYQWYANDTFGNVNRTDVFSYLITKNTTTMTLTIDDVADHATVGERSVVNLTGALMWPSFGLVAIRKSGILLEQSVTPASVLHNFTVPGVFVINASYAGDENYTASWSAWNVTVLDTRPPVVTLLAPENDSTDLDGHVSYAYRVTDSNAVSGCTLYVDGLSNGTQTNPVKGSVLYFTREYATNRNLTWQVRCIDAAGREGNSSLYNLTIQINAYLAQLLPVACSDVGGCSVSNLNVSDGTYESHGILSKNPRDNYVYANMTLAGIPLGSTITNVTIIWEKYQATGSGTFYLSWLNGSNWDLICSKTFTSSTTAAPDDVFCEFPSFPGLSVLNGGIELRANFYYSGSPTGVAFGSDFVGVNVTYELDVSPPSVVLNEPEDGEQRGGGSVRFNFTATDVNLHNCTLWGDFDGSWGPNETLELSDGLTSGVEASFPAILIEPGYYLWNVECYDIAGNRAFAPENRSLNVTPPDLVILSQHIVWNKTGPIEGENITINATVLNDGLTTAEDFLVQFFLGDPDAGGVQIGADAGIASLPGLSNTTVSVTFLARVGPNRIFVRADPDDRIVEVSEANNQANRTFHVDAYATFHGDFRVNITLASRSDDSFLTFFEVNTTSTLFFVRSGTQLDFAALTALGKTTALLNTTDDFSEADGLLNMTGFQDGVNVRWAAGTDRPHTTKSLTVRYQSIVDVPVIESDGTGNFTTGILWDASKDTSSNTEYDALDKEPLVFVADVTQDQNSDYGINDYVAEIPALLRSYAGQPSSLLTIYYELN